MIAELKHSIESLTVQVSQPSQKLGINQIKENMRKIQNTTYYIKLYLYMYNFNRKYKPLHYFIKHCIKLSRKASEFWKEKTGKMNEEKNQRNNLRKNI